MKFITLATLLLLLFAPVCLAQAEGAPRIAEVGPYPNVAPGQIVELRVEGVGEQLLAPPPGDALRILLTQDGATKRASVRTAVPVFLLVRAPKGFRAGDVRVSIENRGANGYSAPVVKTLVLSERR